ncbi:hypothetical protein P9112_009937 [Eukaryota sp. TZLM1-RC]
MTHELAYSKTQTDAGNLWNLGLTKYNGGKNDVIRTKRWNHTGTIGTTDFMWVMYNTHTNALNEYVWPCTHVLDNDKAKNGIFNRTYLKWNEDSEDDEEITNDATRRTVAPANRPMVVSNNNGFDFGEGTDFSRTRLYFRMTLDTISYRHGYGIGNGADQLIERRHFVKTEEHYDCDYMGRLIIWIDNTMEGECALINNEQWCEDIQRSPEREDLVANDFEYNWSKYWTNATTGMLRYRGKNTTEILSAKCKGKVLHDEIFDIKYKEMNVVEGVVEGIADRSEGPNLTDEGPLKYTLIVGGMRGGVETNSAYFEGNWGTYDPEPFAIMGNVLNYSMVFDFRFSSK